MMKAISRAIEGEWPEEWNRNHVVMIHKDRDVGNPENYRGIALIDTIAKVAAKIVAQRLMSWNELDKIVPQEQIGFLRGRAGGEHAAALVEIVQKPSRWVIVATEQGETGSVLSLDDTQLLTYWLAHGHQIVAGSTALPLPLTATTCLSKKDHNKSPLQTYADVIHICCACKALFWTSYGHPCAREEESPSVRVTPQQFVDMRIYL